MKPSTLKGLSIVALLTCTAWLAGCEEGGGSDSPWVSAPAAGAPPATGSGTAVLSWSPPSVNTDDSPVQLLGFVIYRGTGIGDLKPVGIEGASETSTVIAGLPAGMHYFAVTAVGLNGAESAFSNVGAKAID